MFIKALLNSEQSCRCQGSEDEEGKASAYSQEVSEAMGETVQKLIRCSYCHDVVSVRGKRRLMRTILMPVPSECSIIA